MLYPLLPRMTREEMMQFDRLRWLSYSINTCQNWMIQYIDDRNKRLVLRGKTERRRLEAIEALDALKAQTPNDARAIKDAEVEVNNCDKMLTRVNAELEEIARKDGLTARTFKALDEQYSQIREDFPNSWQALLNFDNVQRR